MVWPGSLVVFLIHHDKNKHCGGSSGILYMQRFRAAGLQCRLGLFHHFLGNWTQMDFSIWVLVSYIQNISSVWWTTSWSIQHTACPEGTAGHRAKQAVFPEQGWLEGDLVDLDQDDITSGFLSFIYGPKACVIGREVFIGIEKSSQREELWAKQLLKTAVGSRLAQTLFEVTFSPHMWLELVWLW